MITSQTVTRSTSLSLESSIPLPCWPPRRWHQAISTTGRLLSLNSPKRKDFTSHFTTSSSKYTLVSKSLRSSQTRKSSQILQQVRASRRMRSWRISFSKYGSWPWRKRLLINHRTLKLSPLMKRLSLFRIQMVWISARIVSISRKNLKISKKKILWNWIRRVKKPLPRKMLKKIPNCQLKLKATESKLWSLTCLNRLINRHQLAPKPA